VDKLFLLFLTTLLGDNHSTLQLCKQVMYSVHKPTISRGQFLGFFEKSAFLEVILQGQTFEGQNTFFYKN
jgi:hypothetical protein